MFTVKEKLPDFWNLSKKTAFALRAGKFSDWTLLLQQIKPLLDESFIEDIDKVISGWRKIATLHDGQTALHTLLVFSLCLILPEYTLADEQTCMEIEWAAVLHDLDKNLARSDTAHPFRSAAVVARIRV
jgi:HD-GYP domain-containing protein (c-di-GMP phosphodiesterase class II)